MPFQKRRLFIIWLMAMLMAVTLIPAFGVAAQNEIVLSVSLPEFMRNFLSDDTFAQFEADNPGVKVNVVYNGMDAFFTSSSAQDLSAHLEAIQELASSADVVSVQSSNVSLESTRAGYWLDLSPLTSADSSLNVDDFVPALWQSFQWDGAVWALPVSTDVITVTYDPAAFDQAGLAYPNEGWTIDDFANAARKLAQKDSSGKVSVPGLVTFGNTQYLLRALLGQGFYAVGSLPDAPGFDNPALEALLTTWVELEQEGSFATSIDGDITSAPLRIFSGRGLGPRLDDNTTAPVSSLLPGGVGGLDAQGFAVSSGTLYPEQAYNLAKYLTSNVQLANNPFGIAPARKSLVGVQAQQGDGDGNGAFFLGRSFTPEEQAMIDAGLANGLSVSELRYSEYVVNALDAMIADGSDAHTALQDAEASAVTNLQTAADTGSTTTILVATPVPEIVMQPGEITLNFGFLSFIQPTPNQEQWDQLMRDFATNDPQVGKVNVETDFGAVSEYAANYDCFYLPYNAVPNLDQSTVLNLDPFLDADPSFDRNDIVGNALSLVQKDAKTWALPITIQPEVLRYNTTLFASAGIPAPENGWTIDQFNDALRALKPTADDAIPFVPRGAGGTYLLQLVAAYGGIPLDKRTEPPTINFTDPTNIAAIQQVLDLAKDGYISYSELARSNFSMMIGGETIDPIYTESLNGFSVRMTRGGPGENEQNPYRMTTYPTGSQYNAISYDLGTAYISATTQNADACYRWISTLASHPELFSAMPARRSFINDPAFAASQGADSVAIYNAFDTLMSAPNTINFQSPFGGDTNPGNFLVEYWLNRAFDHYVLEDADLNTELTEAQTFITAYLQCEAGILPFDATTQDRMAYMQQFIDCAGLVDPTISSLFAGAATSSQSQ